MTNPVDYEHHEAGRAFHPPATVAAGVQNLADKIENLHEPGWSPAEVPSRPHPQSLCLRSA